MGDYVATELNSAEAGVTISGVGNATNSSGYADALPPITTLVPSSVLVFGTLQVRITAPNAWVTINASDPNGAIDPAGDPLPVVIVTTRLPEPTAAALGLTSLLVIGGVARWRRRVS